MECIPVMDLLGGQVVRAVRGDRANYRPIESRLVDSAAPLPVATALHARFANTCFYVADLDAIQQQGNNFATLSALLAAFPGQMFWVDAGLRDTREHRQLPTARNLRWIIGSEALPSFSHFHALRAELPEALLSLDHRAESRLGPASLWDTPACWPAIVIGMNLARVGAAAGPDLDLLQQLGVRAPHVTRIAAGGVRNCTDLQALARIGVHHVLVASALHDGSLQSSDFASVTPPAKK